MFKELIVKEKIGKIKILNKEILKVTYPHCGQSNEEISELSEIINQNTYKVKCLIEEIEKLI